MAERLIIQNFAGLNIDIELGRINIFIGPQASGKSVCAKCLYWFKSFLPELLKSAALGQEKKVFDSKFLNNFKEYFPDLWRIDKTLIIRYELESNFIQVENKNSKLLLTYAPVFQEAARNLRREIKSIESRAAATRPNKWGVRGNHSLDLMFEEYTVLDNIKGSLYTILGDAADTSQLFILAGRSFFAALKGAVLSFLVNAPITDPFLREFLGNYELGRRHQPIGTSSRIKALWDLARHILKGQIFVEGDDDYIISEGGKRVKLANASSGQQEAFALVLLLINLVSDDDETPDQGSHTVYIEEPEAHLFPESQRAMAQLMAAIYHESVFSLQYVITTHSPYLLTSFNNLIYAHQLAKTLRNQSVDLKKLYKVVPPSQQLPLADFRVYGFEKGGAHSLIDQETGLLSADLLDSASDVTADQFGDLMALDPATQA